MARPKNVFSAGDDILAEEINENFEEIWQGVNLYGESSEGSDAYAITVDGVEAYSEGMVVAFKADIANTGACSLNINTIGVKSIKKNVGGSMVDLEDYDIEAGQIVYLIYDGTQFQYVNFRKHRYTNGYSTRSESGDQVITHGLGSIPKVIRITASTPSASIKNNQSIGIAKYLSEDAYSSQVLIIGEDGGVAVGSIVNVEKDTSNKITAILAFGSITENTFKLTWTKTGTGVASVSFIWEVEG